MEILSLEGFLSKFPTEQFCHDYFENIRWGTGWGGKIICPFCDNIKVYRLNSATQAYKCSDKKNCDKKFSVLTGTFITNTKLSLQKWFICVYFFAYNKDISPEELSDRTLISTQSTFVIIEKLTLLFDNVSRAMPFNDVFDAVLKNIAYMGDRHEKTKTFKYGNCPIRYYEELSDSTMYQKLVAYIKRRIFFMWYIHIEDFATPTDIISELLIDLHDREDDGNDFIRRRIDMAITNAWVTYIKAHPNLKRKHDARRKGWRDDGRRLLKGWYVRRAITEEKRRRDGVCDVAQITKEEVSAKRNSIAAKRKKNGKIFLDDPEYLKMDVDKKHRLSQAIIEAEFNNYKIRG